MWGYYGRIQPDDRYARPGTRHASVVHVIMQDTTQTPRDAPPLGTIHAILANRRRRFVVDVLAGRTAPIDLCVLARAITMRLPADAPTGDDEPTTGVDDPATAADSTDRLDAITTALHHVDLPRLDRAGVVDYDPDEHTVTPVRAETLAPYLDVSASLQ